MIKRVLFYILGMVVMSYGIAISIKADIGVAPGSTIPYAVSKFVPLSVGMCSALFGISCVLVQLVITRRLTLKVILQFPVSYVFGWFVDLFYGLTNIALPSIWHRVMMLLASVVISALGIRAIVGSNLMLAPSDGLALTIGEKFGWPMSRAKLAFDIFVTVLTLLATWILQGNAFLVVSVGTVICAVGTGPVIGLFTKLLPFLDVYKENT